MTSMAESDTDTQAAEQQPKPYPGLKRLNKLVGAWRISGPDISGQVRYAWMEGGFFLLQHVDIIHGGHTVKGIEIIGYDRGFGATEPSKEIKSHWFGNTGETYDYTYEVDDDTLTIWGGDKGSPAYYLSRWSEDGNTNAGAWHYPGGGYESTMTRIE
jgi:hypothetical protein